MNEHMAREIIGTCLPLPDHSRIRRCCDDVVIISGMRCDVFPGERGTHRALMKAAEGASEDADIPHMDSRGSRGGKEGTAREPEAGPVHHYLKYLRPPGLSPATAWKSRLTSGMRNLWLALRLNPISRFRRRGTDLFPQ